MRILVPSIVDPANGTGGAWTSTRGFLALLAQIFPEAKVSVPALPDWSPASRRLRQFSSVLRSLAGPYPAKIIFATHAPLLDAVRSTPTPDLIILNGSDLLWLLPHLPPSVPVAVLAHNLEFRLFQEQAQAWGFLARPEIQKHHRFELAGLSRVGHAIFLSHEERREALEHLPSLSTLVVPPIFSYQPEQVRPELSGTLRLGLLSNFGWWPNLEALQWFLRRVWPALEADVELHLFGPGIGRIADRHRNIVVHGHVTDTRQAYRVCHLAIVPVLRGAGVKIKLAEALYNGVPTLTTAAGARGITTLGGAHILDDPQDWIRFLNGTAAREFAATPVPSATRNQFSPDTIRPALVRFLEDVLHASTQRNSKAAKL